MKQRLSTALAVWFCLLCTCLGTSACAVAVTSSVGAGTPAHATTSAAGSRTSTTSGEARASSATVAPSSTTIVPPSTTLADTSSSPCGRLKNPSRYRHIIWILEENNSYGSIYQSPSAPYINSIAEKCGIASNYHNITHDSLPNYLALTDGATLSLLQPFTGDCWPSPACQLSTNNIFSQLSTAGGWKGFDESMPTSCDRGGGGTYAPKHNPVVYYTDLTTCPANDVALGTTADSPLLNEFARQSTAPAFSFVTPNLCDDMHGATGCQPDLVQAGDTWLNVWLPLILASPVYKSGDTAVFIAWDEGAGGFAGENCATHRTDESCHVPLIVIAPSVKPGTVDGALVNHYSLLKTTEDLLGVRELGLARAATSLSSPFNL